MKLIPQGVTRSFGRAMLHTKKNSPHIFFGLGVAGIIGGTILACKSTLKLPETIDEIEKDVVEAKANHNENTQDSDRYKDLAPVYLRGCVKIGKLYAPAIVLGGASIAAITGSHVQMTRRNSALSATLALVSKAYDDYRERVREEVGEERERDLYRCMEDVELAKDGTVPKMSGTVVSPGRHSPYAKIFDEANKNWVKNSEMNRMFIQCQQAYANDRLNAYGHVFLNEVYDWLGIERTPAGQIVGWVKNNPTGDNHIDFGLFEPSNDLFMTGQERSVWLDFNVDGPIYELI